MITLAVASAATAYAVGVLFEKYVLGALAHRPPSVTVQMFVALAATAVLWILAGVLFAARLLVHVFDDAVVLRYAPFTHEVRIELWQIESVEPITYRPFKDVGGWGIRMDDNRVSYTVDGTRAVLIRTRDGEEIMIGSQRPLALTAAIRDALGSRAAPDPAPSEGLGE